MEPVPERMSVPEQVPVGSAAAAMVLETVAAALRRAALVDASERRNEILCLHLTRHHHKSQIHETHNFQVAHTLGCSYYML